MVFTLLLIFFTLLSGLYAQNAEVEDEFEGIVVYVDQSKLEIKSGAVEKKFKILESTRVENKSGKPMSLKVSLCQKVKVTFLKIKDNPLKKIIILRPGYCGKWSGYTN